MWAGGTWGGGPSSAVMLWSYGHCFLSSLAASRQVSRVFQRATVGLIPTWVLNATFKCILSKLSAPSMTQGPAVCCTLWDLQCSHTHSFLDSAGDAAGPHGTVAYCDTAGATSADCAHHFLPCQLASHPDNALSQLETAGHTVLELEPFLT